MTEDTSEVLTSERRRGIERSQTAPPPDNAVQMGTKYDQDIHKKQPIAAKTPDDYNISPKNKKVAS